MAETLLTFAAEKILEKVSSIAIQEIAGANPWRLKKDLQNLSELTKSIHGKVQEARNNQEANKQAVKPLLIKLQDVLYSAEDVLDEFSYEILRREIEIQSQPWLRVHDFASRNNPIFFRLKMAYKVKKINESLADIEKQGLREIAFTGKAVADPIAVSNDQLNRVTVSYFDKSTPPVIGRASEVKAIINMLHASSSSPSLLTVVSIVGFGGVGKTTLAKMVLHEVKKTKLFDETIWVCVSEPFDIKTILKGMLETVDKNAGGLDNVEAILQHVEKKLKDKRFFLVLDDVWEHSRIKCDCLKSHLLTLCNRAGNFVIVTTRRFDVAKAMDTRDEHVVPLRELADKECWDIIREKCLMQWRLESMPEELEQIGVGVAKRCKGVPLAAKVAGGILCNKKNREEWLSIKNSEAWEQVDEDNQIFPVLKLSFHQLDSSLKQCFVYCSLFPKNFVYDKEILIELWMAEGFLNTTSTSPGSSMKSMEAVGDECFNGLIDHSLFQDVQVDKWGNIRSCKMHDLLHDLATSVSNYKMLKLNYWSICFVRTSNHQHHPNAEELKRGGARNVRSVMSHVVGDISYMLCTFKRLRSLDISFALFEELPSVIGRLKHLRYLDISHNRDIKELPEFIAKLYNLQTLRMIRCWKIKELPTSMVNLVRLRHLHVDVEPSYLQIYNVGHLTELRTLEYFGAGTEEGFQIGELKGLNKLRGKLLIGRLDNVKNREEAEGANLKEKKLTELELNWWSSFDRNCNYEDVLEGLLPPPTIKSLRIDGYKGVKFSNWMSKGINSSQLVELNLDNCNKCEIMPSLGHLPRLKNLMLDGLDNIRSISSEFYGECTTKAILFPKLKIFSLRKMKSLQQWAALVASEKRNVEVFPLLEDLYIEECPSLRSIPLRHLSSLELVKIEGCADMEYLSNDSQRLPSLNYLKIIDCKSLVSLSSLQDLESLEKLKIRRCARLTSLSKGLVSLETLVIDRCGNLSLDAFCGLSSLKSLSIRRGRMESIPNVERPSYLEELSIYKCGKVKSVPHWIKLCNSLSQFTLVSQGLISIDDDMISSLTQLEELCLGGFSEELENFPGLNSIHNLLSLKTLEIRGWPKLKSLPQQLQHLAGLKYLTVRDFKGIETLADWLDNLSSLQQLELRKCDNLKNLPIPTMKRLSNLTSLQSHGCPLLAQRYKKNIGPEWHHISHIARIDLR